MLKPYGCMSTTAYMYRKIDCNRFTIFGSFLNSTVEGQLNVCALVVINLLRRSKICTRKFYIVQLTYTTCSLEC